MIKASVEASMHFSEAKSKAKKGYILTLDRSIVTLGPDSPVSARNCRVTHAQLRKISTSSRARCLSPASVPVHDDYAGDDISVSGMQIHAKLNAVGE